MSEKIIVPSLGESVTEATVSKWLKSVGEAVDSDEPLVELETDKVNVEVPSPSNGVLEKITVKEGDTVAVGSLLGSVGIASSKTVTEKKEKRYIPPLKEEEMSLYEEKVEKPAKTKKKKKSNNGAQPLLLEEAQEEPALILKEEQKVDEPQVSRRKKTASPSARKIAQERNINLNEIEGSGKRGTVLKGDLLDLMGSKPSPNIKRQTLGKEERIIRQSIK